MSEAKAAILPSNNIIPPLSIACDCTGPHIVPKHTQILEPASLSFSTAGCRVIGNAILPGGSLILDGYTVFYHSDIACTSIYTAPDAIVELRNGSHVTTTMLNDDMDFFSITPFMRSTILFSSNSDILDVGVMSLGSDGSGHRNIVSTSYTMRDLLSDRSMYVGADGEALVLGAMIAPQSDITISGVKATINSDQLGLGHITLWDGYLYVGDGCHISTQSIMIGNSNIELGHNASLDIGDMHYVGPGIYDFTCRVTYGEAMVTDIIGDGAYHTIPD